MNRAIFDHVYRVLRVDESHQILETLAECNNWDIAFAAYKASQQTRSYALIQLREKSRIVWTAKTGAYDSKTEKIEVLWER